ncbi:MAG: hypothetical protein ACREFQ_05185 [Stellaceae bacterium]
MKVTNLPNGDLALDLSLDELSWFGQALNECHGGFGVKDFQTAVGATADAVEALLNQIVAMYPATLGGGADDADR